MTQAHTATCLTSTSIDTTVDAERLISDLDDEIEVAQQDLFQTSMG
jgi:hypothetical protein